MKIYHFYTLLLILVILSCNSRQDDTLDAGDDLDNNVPRVSIAQIEVGIKEHIADKTEDGYFHITDDEHDLKLKLVRVHTEYLSNLGPKRHFACVDLADVSGDVYDVDFFLAGDPGDMRVTETTVHKLNGKPFYTWKQHEDKTWGRVPVEEASNQLLGIIEGEDQFQFIYEATLPEISGNGELWIPLAQSDKFQMVEKMDISNAEGHRVIKDEVYGNDILYMKLDPSDSKKEIKITYDVNRLEKSSYADDTQNFDRYLKGTELLPVGGRFKEMVDEVLFGIPEDNPLMRARALYDYIIDNVQYKKEGLYGTGDANYACDSKRGNCTEFHSFFISLARTAGIPARFSIGASIPSERNEGGIDGYHCWAEFYAEGKWWPVDISEGNKYTALATYYFGHHPANRIELSRGRDLEIDPMPSSGPINFHAYPVLEVDQSSLAVKTRFSFLRQKK